MIFLFWYVGCWVVVARTMLNIRWVTKLVSGIAAPDPSGSSALSELQVMSKQIRHQKATFEQRAKISTRHRGEFPDDLGAGLGASTVHTFANNCHAHMCEEGSELFSISCFITQTCVCTVLSCTSASRDMLGCRRMLLAK